jgi:L-amino acid N-acyltransferase YncA
MVLVPLSSAAYRSRATLEARSGKAEFPQPEQWAETYAPTTLIAERGEVVVGYAYYQLLSGIGYVRNVVSAAEARRTGVGKALMFAMADIFRAHSVTSKSACPHCGQGTCACGSTANVFPASIQR